MERNTNNKSQRILTLAALLFGVVGLAAFSMSPSSTVTSGVTFLQATSPDSAEQEVMRAYIQFIAEYGRSYTSKEHANERYEVFKRNYETIKVHNKHVAALPYTMSVNHFADMTPQEFQALNRIEVPRALVARTAEEGRVHTHEAHVHSQEHYQGKHKHVTRKSKH